MSGRTTTAEAQPARARGSSPRGGGRASGRGALDALLARGNRRLLRALAIRAKPRVVAATDAREREANEVAQRLVGGEEHAAVSPRGAGS
ncbi:MAG: hypothetical protein HOQ34_03605, partial [Gemmatimonadaceae bacterium]|nr:hypothetical protein [Gemmatimonadaceae bacterium]